MDKQKDFEKGWEDYKEKKKQEIEETEKDIVRSAGLDVHGKARYLYDLGYRKIPKNAVVLTREELYEKLYNAGHNKQEDNKELAQKIYDDIFAILKIKLWLYGDDTMTKTLNGISKQKILDFTKKWGIEDNHLNERDYSHIDHLQAHDRQIKEKTRKETAEKFAERLKDYYNWGFPFVLTIQDKQKLFAYIDEICKEITEGNK